MLRLSALGLGLFLLLSLLTLDLAIRWVPFDPDRLFPGGTGTVVVDRRGRTLRAYLAQDDRWRLPANPRRVSRELVLATLAAEDQRFYQHGGIDLWAVARAAVKNTLGIGRRSGASTLTMQAVALEDPPPRTYLRKLRQAFHALQLERVATKDQILALYLTHAPYGGNVCGVEAAARKWLGKPASELSLAEAALLAGLPQAPSRFRPDRFPGRARQRMMAVLRRMVDERLITREQYLRALRQPLAIGPGTSVGQTALRNLPRLAPHFCDMVRARSPEPGLVRSTLDLPTQELVEARLRRHLEPLRRAGISNGAVVVLDVADASVRALAGSADILDRTAQGQVNGAVAPRPAGSTLKPFLYALAYDQGLLLPGELLPDVPTVFSGYRPQNSDRAFRGPVPADEALAWSLNLPALEVLRRLTVPKALSFLRAQGLGTLQQRTDRYGLSLAIGTGSVTLLDLTAACATLARNGVTLPPRLLAAQPLSTGTQTLSPGACALVNLALANPQLRPPDEVAANLLGMEGVAWKTGTSNGQRDAWTVAWNDQLVVGVWMGNFDNQPSPALMGFTAAAPLALNLIREIHQRQNPDTSHPGKTPWPALTPDLETLTVCTGTGAEPNPSCPTTATALAIRGPRPACRVHRTVALDRATGTLLCTRCQSDRPTSSVVRAFHAAPMAAWLLRNPPANDPLLPEEHFADCPSQPPRPGPVILHPRDGEVYILDPTRPPEAQKLQPAIAGPTSGVLWFLNGRLLTSDPPLSGGPGHPSPEGINGPRIPLQPGRHRLRAITPAGQATEVTFDVLATLEQ